MIEPPYGDIWDLLCQGKVIPFLGAGASICGELPHERYDPESCNYLPNGGLLAQFLADQVQFPSNDPRDRDDLAKVSSYSAEVSGRPQLRRRLRQVFGRRYDFGKLHSLLAAVPRC
jgi:hypothetical protein